MVWKKWLDRGICFVAGSLCSLPFLIYKEKGNGDWSPITLPGGEYTVQGFDINNDSVPDGFIGDNRKKGQYFGDKYIYLDSDNDGALDRYYLAHKTCIQERGKPIPKHFSISHRMPAEQWPKLDTFFEKLKKKTSMPKDSLQGLIESSF